MSVHNKPGDQNYIRDPGLINIMLNTIVPHLAEHEGIADTAAGDTGFLTRTEVARLSMPASGVSPSSVPTISVKAACTATTKHDQIIKHQRQEKSQLLVDSVTLSWTMLLHCTDRCPSPRWWRWTQRVAQLRSTEQFACAKVTI